MSTAPGTSYAIAAAVQALLLGDASFVSLFPLDVKLVDGAGNPTPAIYNEFKSNTGPLLPQCCFRIVEGQRLKGFRTFRIKSYFIDMEYWTESQSSTAMDAMYEAGSRLLDEVVLNLTPWDGGSQSFLCYEVSTMDSGYSASEHAYRSIVRYRVIAGRNRQ